MKTATQASSTIRVSLWDEDIKFHDEVGSDTFSFMFFHNVQGADTIYIVYNKKNENVGTLTIKSQYEADPVKPAAKPEEKKIEEKKVVPAQPPKVEEKKVVPA